MKAHTSQAWLILWLDIDPTLRRYQEPVPLSHVLAEHHAALAAEPADGLPATTNPRN